jgi:hypothetical protein
MSIDFYSTVDSLRQVAANLLLAFAASRALLMGREFVSPIYRSRAFWSAGLIIVIVIGNLSNYLPSTNSDVLAILFVGPFIALLLAVLAFVDRTVLVAIETDFFHRGILRWQILRRPAYVAMVVGFVVFIVSSFFVPADQNAPVAGDSILVFVAFYQFVVVFAVVFGFAAAALAVGARRTPDLTLKRHIRFLAMALGIFIVNLLLSVATNDVVPFDLVDDALGLTSTYMLYRSVMSLSPIGRVQKDTMEPRTQTPIQ